MKTIFSNNSDVAHLWANQLQKEAKTSNRTFYFYDKTIYSFGSHFPIAKFVNDKTVLFTERTYSVTTAKHKNLVYNAISHLDKIFCPYPNGTHNENFDYWTREAESLSKGLINARKPEKWINEINNVHTKAYKYAMFFNVIVPELLENILSVKDKKEVLEYMANKQAIIEAENKRKEANKKKEHKIELNKWRLFERGTMYLRDGFDYLRKADEYFETSQGVKIPINVGLRLYKGIKGLSVGDKFLEFTVNEVNKDFIGIGCHKITFKEIKLIIK